MTRTQYVAFAALAVLAAVIVVLGTRNRQPPLLPGDEPHRTFVSATDCRECHGPDGLLPQGPNHPVGEDCLRCHGHE